jgi:hypothetical protein
LTALTLRSIGYDKDGGTLDKKKYPPRELPTCLMNGFPKMNSFAIAMTLFTTNNTANLFINKPSMEFLIFRENYHMPIYNVNIPRSLKALRIGDIGCPKTTLNNKTIYGFRHLETLHLIKGLWSYGGPRNPDRDGGYDREPNPSCDLVLDDTTFLYLKNLKQLILLEMFGGKIHPSISLLSKLTFLHLQKNLIQNDNEMTPLSQLSNLRSLILEENYVEIKSANISSSFKNASYLSNLKELRSLKLIRGKFQGYPVQYISTLTKLTLLDIREQYGDLRGSVHGLKMLINLERLDLSNNQFNGSITWLSSLNKLTCLDVRNNQFTLESINNDFFLKHLPKLAILNIGRNQDMDGIDCTKLKNAMPDLLQCWRL